MMIPLGLALLLIVSSESKSVASGRKIYKLTIFLTFFQLFALDRFKRLLPPAYLSVDGHVDCLESYESPEAVTLVCLPLSKKPECNPTAWDGLKNVISAVKADSLPVLVPGSESCLIQFKGEKCLPDEAPPNSECTSESFTFMKEHFKGKRCPGLAPTFLVSVKPPAYLSVEGHKTCLDNYKASKSHKEVCLPRLKNPECPDAAWSQLLDVFVGVGCPVVSLPEGLEGLPPSYLSIEGHKACLDVYQSEGTSHKTLCLPVDKPPSPCEDSTWQQLLTSFNGITCPREKEVSLSVGQPAYLSLASEVIDNCLGLQRLPSGFKMRCLPSDKPVNCADQAAWEDLVKTFRGITCSKESDQESAPEYLSIEGHDSCLSGFNASSSFRTQCMPKSRPNNDECTDEVWNQLVEKYTGIGCPQSLDSALFVYVPDYVECMGLIESNEYCLPQTVPEDCSENAWRELKKYYNGIRCPAIFYGQLGIPTSSVNLDLSDQVTSIDGYSECLKYKEIPGQPSVTCLPFTKPSKCPLEAWQLMQEILGPDHCRVIYLDDNGSLQLPPSAIELGAQTLCLSTDKKSDRRRECLPVEKPEQCPDHAWSLIEDPAAGERCSLEKTVDGDLILPKSITEFNDYKLCLKSAAIPGQIATQCIPLQRPDDCAEEIYKMLELIAGQDLCRTITRVTEYQVTRLPPSYLGIPGHELCLGTHITQGGHSVRCLPQVYPIDCNHGVWRELLQTFEGIRCALEKIVVESKSESVRTSNPGFLQISGHQDCLKEQLVSSGHMEKCIPEKKPVSCSIEAWVKVKKEFIGSECRDNVDILPSHFQTIPGYERCLKVHADDPLQMCLPQSREYDCPQEAWDSLKISYRGDNCPLKEVVNVESYLFVEGHEDCLEDALSFQAKKCMPLFKPDRCSQEAYDGIYSLAFASTESIQDLPKPEFHNCLGTQQASGTSNSERCIPLSKPPNPECTEETWVEVQEQFRGSQCRLEPAEAKEVFFLGPPDPNEIRVAFCNTDGDCKPDVFDNPICNLFFSQLTDQVGNKWDGVCVPKFCNSKQKCPDIGNLHSGMVQAVCKTDANRCEYDQAFIIA